MRPFFARINQFTSSLRVWQQTLLCSLVILISLQVWRPYYFLTDDNLTFSYPIISAIGFNLGHRKLPFINEFLFGGHYNLLHDASALLEWNPIVLGFSLLANTRFAAAIVDLVASAYLLGGAVGFTFLLCYLRQLYELKISDGRIVFLSLSFVFSGYALETGPSWVIFLANQATLPILLLGLFHQRRTTGIWLVALGIVCTLLAGHPSPFLWTLFFLTAFAVAWCVVEKTLEPLRRWGLGIFFGFTLVSPLLFLAVQGFGNSSRSGALSLQLASACAVPAPLFFVSLWSGYMGVMAYVAFVLHRLPVLVAFPSCAASWGVFQRPSPGKRVTVGVELCLIGVALLVVLFVSRPNWLGLLVSHMPLYRSLRWPFRETFLFLFFFHVWLALRPATLSPRANVILNGLGSIVFLYSLFTLTPWSFRSMRLDRELVISGQAQDYWQRVQGLLGPNDQIISVADPNLLLYRYEQVPFSLLGGYNYPSLFRVRSASGYAPGGLSPNALGGIQPSHWSGTYSPKNGARLLALYPYLKAVQLVSLRPLRFEIRSAHSSRVLELPPLAVQSSLQPLGKSGSYNQ